MALATYQSFAHSSGTLGNAITVTKPSGTVDGNLLLAFWSNANNGTAVTPPAGWTVVAGANSTDAIYSKVAASEGASWTWTPGVLAGGKVVVVRIAGQKTSSPVVASSILAYNNRTSWVLTGVTATANNLLLQVIGTMTTGVSFTPPGTATERFDTGDAASNVSAGGDEMVGAGATGTRTWASGAANGAGFMVAIAPSATDYTQSADLVGVGVLTHNKADTMTEELVGVGVVTHNKADTMLEALTGDGVVSRSSGVTMSEAMTGDGVVSRQFGVTMSDSLTGDGTITESHQQAFTRVFDLTGDGVLTSAKATVASKTFDLVGDGTITGTPGAGYFRAFDLVGDGVITGSADIPFPVIPECAPDWTPNDGLKSIEGDVFFHEPPNEGDPVVGADVTLIRDSDGARIDTTTTDGAGHYVFPRDTNDPYTYHVEVRYLDQQGLSEGGCVPA